MISFTLDLEPVAKGRPRMGRGFAFTPLKTRKFEADVKRLAQKHKPKELLTGPVSVKMRFYFGAPKRPKHREHIVKPDLSNLVKGVEDALNGVMWKDDSQITELTLSKLYDYMDRRPRIDVQIETITPQRREKE